MEPIDSAQQVLRVSRLLGDPRTQTYPPNASQMDTLLIGRPQPTVNQEPHFAKGPDANALPAKCNVNVTAPAMVPPEGCAHHRVPSLKSYSPQRRC